MSRSVQLEPRTGTVYLVCFERPFRSGDGARLLRAVTAAGIGWQVVRTWSGVGREYERRLKNQKATARLCPVCGKAWRDKDAERKRTKRRMQ